MFIPPLKKVSKKFNRKPKTLEGNTHVSNVFFYLKKKGIFHIFLFKIFLISAFKNNNLFFRGNPKFQNYKKKFVFQNSFFKLFLKKSVFNKKLFSKSFYKKTVLCIKSKLFFRVNKICLSKTVFL